jgi:anaerobic selenocysteine-containing dehydrogenase
MRLLLGRLRHVHWVSDGRAVSVRGNPEHAVNSGLLCPKGLSEHYTLAASNRARYPLLRNKRGKLARIGWNQALATMVEKFREVQEKHGHDALGVLSTGQLVTEEFYTLGKLVQLGFGTKNYDGNTTLCMASAVSGYKISFGSDGPPGVYEDLSHAQLGTKWRASWQEESIERAGIFSYRGFAVTPVEEPVE